jgi:hypothetical protein
MAEVHMIVLGHDAILKHDDPALSLDGKQLIETATLGLESATQRIAYPKILPQRVNAYKFRDMLNILDMLEVPGLKTWPTLNYAEDELINGVATRVEDSYVTNDIMPADSEVLITIANKQLVNNLCQYSGGMALTTTVQRQNAAVHYSIQPVAAAL